MLKAPKQVYNSRKPNTNPRTGEPLQDWAAVQVLDPSIPPLATYFVRVEVQNSEGNRKQTFKVRAPAGLAQTEELLARALETAQSLGFTTTGVAVHD